MTDPDTLFNQLTQRKLPPVNQWHPDFSGEINIRIARDGAWFHDDSLISRERLIKLFSTIIRREADGYFYLVTPMEKWRIQVEDAPFVAVAMDHQVKDGVQQIKFRTNVDDIVPLNGDHPLRIVEDITTTGPSPYIRVRDNLDALLTRPVYYELVDLAETDTHNGYPCLSVYSNGERFILGYPELEPLEE